MQYATHGNGNGLDNLYIMPENGMEREASRMVVEMLRKQGRWIETFIGSKGSASAGLLCYDIPLGEHLKSYIEVSINAIMGKGV